MIEVIKKQENSKNCFVCGLENKLGLGAAFYELENKELVGLFRTTNGHQSYPGRMHGGVSAAILDETIGRAISIFHPGTFGVTVDLNVQYKKPLPLGTELRCVGRIINDRGRIFEGSGEILLPNGEIAVKATGKYMRLPIDKIAGTDFDHDEWFVQKSESDPKGIEI